MKYDLSVDERSIHYIEPLDGNESFKNRSSFIIKLSSQNNIGYGESAPLEGWTENKTTVREKLMELSEKSPIEGPRLEEVLENLWGETATRYGLHQAIVDHRAKRNNCSLCSFFGNDESRRDSISVNDLLVDNPTVGKLADSVQSGYDTVKIKSTPGEMEIIDELSIRPDWESELNGLRIDYNETLDQKHIETVVKVLEGIPLDYVEQPFDRSRLDLHRKLREEGIPVALDESLLEYSLKEIQNRGAADAIVIKPMAMGGLDRAAETIRECVEYDLKPVITTLLEGAIGRAGTIQLSLGFSDDLGACGLATGKFIRGDCDWESNSIKDGKLYTPSNTGNSLPQGLRRRA
ncbi:MAG: enolase C-terminal domain-like protein [bacterium]